MPTKETLAFCWLFCILGLCIGARFSEHPDCIQAEEVDCPDCDGMGTLDPGCDLCLNSGIVSHIALPNGDCVLFTTD